MTLGNRKQRVLLTARSACAAWGIVEIWRLAVEHEKLDIHLVAQEPAATIFRAENVPFTFLDMPTLFDPESGNSLRLLEWTEDFLKHLNPDAALVGLSAPNEGGIDEAVLLHAKCPTFVLQDFWGDCNLFFAHYADCYLTPDEEGARATTESHGAHNLVLGSPRHARYAGKNMLEMAETKKTHLGLDPRTDYFGFFCQPLFRFDGYRRMVEDWARTVNSLGAVDVIYRPHPSSDDAQISAIETILSDAGLSAHLAVGGPIEDALSACAVATSALSNSNVDAAYINHFSDVPLVVPVYMLYEPDIVDYLKDFQDLHRIPAVEQGLARAVLRRDDVEAVLKSAMSQETREAAWKAAHALPNPVEALEKTIEILLKPDDYVKQKTKVSRSV